MRRVAILAVDQCQGLDVVGPLEVFHGASAALRRSGRPSTCNFARIFREETGATPARYVEQIRIEAARRFLESSKKSVEEIAEATGFASPEGLRRAFARRVGASPSEYRTRSAGRARGAAEDMTERASRPPRRQRG